MLMRMLLLCLIFGYCCGSGRGILRLMLTDVLDIKTRENIGKNPSHYLPTIPLIPKARKLAYPATQPPLTMPLPSLLASTIRAVPAVELHTFESK